MVSGASSGPLTSMCSATPSGASAVNSRPRSSPSGSPTAASGDSRSRLAASRSAARIAPAPAAVAPATMPTIPVIRRHLAMSPPALGPSACYSTVTSGCPAAERDGDLVGDRPQRVRPLLDGRLAGVTGAEKYHLVAGRGGSVAEVEHELVHAHRARDGPAAPAGEHLRAPGRGAGQALRVAHRHQAERAGRRGDVPVPVGHP